MSTPFKWLDREAAAAAIERCAHEEAASGRRIVHCFAGSVGADWDAADALVAVEEAHTSEDGQLQVAFVDSLFGRCLAVLVPRDDGELRRLLFDTVTPEEEP